MNTRSKRITFLKQRLLVVDWLRSHQEDGVVVGAWKGNAVGLTNVSTVEFGIGRPDLHRLFAVGTSKVYAVSALSG